MLFEPHVLAALHFDRHRTGVKNSCGFRFAHHGGEISHDCMEQVLTTYHYSNKKNIQDGARNVIPLIVHITRFYCYKTI